MKNATLAGLAGAVAIAVGLGVATTSGAPVPVPPSRQQIQRAVAAAEMQEAIEQSVEGDEEIAGEEGDREARRGPGGEGPAAEQVQERAFPKHYVTTAQAKSSRRAYDGLPNRLTSKTAGSQAAAMRSNVAAGWTALGPSSARVPATVTYTGRETHTSGRVTAMAIAPTCVSGNCRLWVAAAGGGIWRTDDALAATPTWKAVDAGLTTNAFGSLLVDPRDVSGNTLYAGSGEANLSGDSEAGLGLFKTTNGGDSWSLVDGSQAASKGNAISSILIPGGTSTEIWIATTTAVRGASSVSGAYYSDPTAPTEGVYKSTDNGANWTRQTALPSGSAMKLVEDPNHNGEIYAALYGRGIFRTGHPSEPGWNKVFNVTENADFDLADRGATTRIYAGNAQSSTASLWVADDVDTTTAAALLTAQGTSSSPWVNRSSSSIGTPDGYSSYNWCQRQCWYDSFVEADPSNPDTVFLGGAMNYNEIGGLSNGRAVVRSTNAGARFTDMTEDQQTPPLGMHPDQHALVFNPNDTAQVFIGSDGGVVRTSGQYASSSSRCNSRTLSGTSLTFCQNTLSSVPTRLDSLNIGLNTLQFQSLTPNPDDPFGDVMGGTQDNGTWGYDGSDWVESVGGDGGQSGISPGVGTRMHTYYGPSPEVSTSMAVGGWRGVSTPLYADNTEYWPFYVAMIADPSVAGTYFIGGLSIWRTQDSGGAGTGNWVKVGPRPGAGDNTIATLSRAASDSSTLWVGMRDGGLYISKNIDAAAGSVTLTKISTAATPGRFISGIAVDGKDPNHAWISYSGYSSNTPVTPGHVFEATYTPGTGATFTDISYDLGDQPVTGIARDDLTGDLYASTDFGVARLAAGTTTWTQSSTGLPFAAVFGVSMNGPKRVLYAATHGRGAYQLALNPIAQLAGPESGNAGEAMTFDSAGSQGFKGSTVRWNFPNGPDATTPTATYRPNRVGPQQVSLTVTDSLGHSTTTTKTVTVSGAPTPSITSVSPDRGLTSGGTPVTVSGVNLSAVTEVTLGGVPCVITGSPSTGSLTCTTGPHPAGPVDAYVVQADTQYATLNGAFTYTEPAPNPPATPTPGPLKPPAPVTALKVKATTSKVGARWLGSADRFTVSLRGSSAKGKRVVKSTSVARGSASFKVKLKKKSSVTVCVIARNADGASPPTCVKTKVRKK